MPRGKKSKNAGTARSAKTGQFVTQAHAKKNPSTTVVHRPKKKGK